MPLEQSTLDRLSTYLLDRGSRWPISSVRWREAKTVR